MAVRTRLSIPVVTWLAGAFLLAVFLTGGGSRADVSSLVLLRPIAAVACVFFLSRLTRPDWHTVRFLAAIGGATVLLTLLQLIPLPPALWQSLPGRQILEQAITTAGVSATWHPFSIAPWRTLNALMYWLVPIGAAAAVAGSDTAHRHRMMLVLVALGLVSGLVSILQVIGPPGGPLYLYRQTSLGDAVGLYANRNHNALLLVSLFPLLGAFACTDVRSTEQHRRRLWMSLAIAAALVPLVLVVGSRAGVILLGVGTLSTLFVYRRPPAAGGANRTAARPRRTKIWLAAGLLALVGISFLFSRATALSRLAGTGVTGDTRLQIWDRSWSLAQKYFPTGAGFGTFVETYQLDEPREILRNTYANHAHNDWLEVLVGGGLAGAALLLACVVTWLLAVRRLWNRRTESGRDQVLGRTGAAILLLVGIASFFDYPARTPSIAALCAIAAVWIAYALREARS